MASRARLATYSLEGATALTTMTASGCLPCDTLATQNASTTPPQTTESTPPSSVTVGTPLSPRWEGVIGVEGEMTGDGRLIETNALVWDVPFPLRYVSQDMGAHDGAVVVGRVTSVERRPGGVLWATGDFDTNSTYGLEAQRQVAENLTNGVSMDLDDVSFEVRIAADLLEDGGPLGMLLAEDDPGDTVPMPEPDKDGRVKVLEMKSDDEVRVTTAGRIRASTIVAIPAFASAMIHLSEDVEGLQPETPSLAAGAAPVAPPIGWFARPRFSGPTPLTVGKDGRVQGHIALWDTCHTSHTAPGQCIKPPRSATGYAYFLTGSVLTAEGTEVPVGHITLDTNHANEHATPAETLAHYEHTGKVAADVMAGDDEWGIWVAGACRSNLSDEDVRALRSAPISGDWRRIGGTLELVAALGVNVPGFPVPRPKGLVASGEVVTLVASGMLTPRVSASSGLSLEDVAYLKQLAKREREAKRVPEPPDERALRVHAFALRRRVHH